MFKFLKVVAPVSMMMALSSLSSAATISQHIYGTSIGELFQAADPSLLKMLSAQGGDPWTLFFPSDMYLHRDLARRGSSIDQLKQDQAALNEFLRYHMVSGNYSREDLFNEKLLNSYSGRKIRVNSYPNGQLTLQGETLQDRIYVASNGMIHYTFGIIDPANGSVTDIINSQSDLSTLMTAARATGLLEFLIDQTPITIFAPTNQAFQALGQDKVDSLLNNTQLLEEIIKYHVVPGTIYSAGVSDMILHTFEEQDRLHLTTQLRVDEGQIQKDGLDMSATNGVLHKIDHVLIPQSLRGQI